MLEPLTADSLGASLTVVDLPRSVSWYCDTLGFSVDRRHEREGTLFAVSLTAGAVSILLTQDTGARGLERAKGEGMSLMISTSQRVDSIAQRVQQAGWGFDTELTTTPWGVRMFRVRDPDGFRLTIAATRAV